MSHQSELISSDIHAYLAQHERKELLRLLTCGNVDDGKSTLIGRLLHDSKMIYEDQLEAIKSDSVKSGTTGEEVDLALLVDGLQAEREQGITIDVAYRYFSTAKRKFIIADTPGHEQYTRNMATGASTCDLAVILIDARHGVQTQTKRHSFITSLLGIKHTIIAVNKMDLVDFSEQVFNDIRNDFLDFAEGLNMNDVRFVPLSALNGDNVVNLSESMPWYKGKPLMEILESVEIASDRNFDDLRFPVQYVNRPNLNFRGYCGTLASGVVQPGDEISVLPSGKRSKVKSIVTYDGDLDQAFAPMAITLTLEDEIDISRGDIIVHAGKEPVASDRFNAHLVWMNEAPLLPGKEYLVKIGTTTVTGHISSLRHKIDVNTLEQQPGAELALNEIALCELSLDRPVIGDDYSTHQGTGSFIVVDRLSNLTVGAGMITQSVSHDSVQLSDSQLSDTALVSREDRARRFGQQATKLYLTGASEEQRQAVANSLEKQLFDLGRAVTQISDTQLQLAINQDLGGSDSSREQAAMRLDAVAELMLSAGLICLCVSDTAPSYAKHRVQINPDSPADAIPAALDLLKQAGAL
ncbi:sulfate adenylyltransferase subunit CysN [Motiliproteus coralliicola]|uniref:Sulfate adenylyltransferase subunit 1 n=1 Tax=Motiliproteus coralliicola TaxID=2283196 RepID=A0A369WE93_9GAMM|nr:sulfate adenylyltransferase subunit CysN [Motiliproteus coralliicola]RDE19469.1 sulfate adenylyltransferase subunit CysN [Motiliproteus coralliicola]